MQTSGATKFNSGSPAPTARSVAETDILWSIRGSLLKTCIGDDEPQAIHLIAELAKHGLVIVESARHDKLLTALQLVASVLEPIVEGSRRDELPYVVWRALRDVVTKIKEL
jgi:hypothetical protein